MLEAQPTRQEPRAFGLDSTARQQVFPNSVTRLFKAAGSSTAPSRHIERCFSLIPEMGRLQARACVAMAPRKSLRPAVVNQGMRARICAKRWQLAARR